ncbi:MAG: PLD nuclease N-terminal domain-containing protein [Fusobacteriaceae bacterium]|jgi:hypothetical protein|nr:PLD nuclease N-terminal domain-containing protein [Fusobacteriaceae bacterium]
MAENEKNMSEEPVVKGNEALSEEAKRLKREESGRMQDRGGCLWALLGLLFPYVGVILWFVWRKGNPRTAEAVGKGSLISILFFAIFILIFFGIFFLNTYLKTVM